MRNFVDTIKKGDEEYDIRDVRVPESAIADAGKVVKVAEDGSYELGEAGGGTQLYKHRINQGRPILIYYDNKSTAATKEDIYEAIGNSYFGVSADVIDSSMKIFQYVITSAGYPGAPVTFKKITFNVADGTSSETTIGASDFTDTVTAL